MYSGLGVDRITKILSLRKTSFTCWEKHYTGEGVDFEMLFQDVLAQFEGEAEEFLYQRFQDELIGTMKKSLPLGYEDILLEITQQQDQLRRSTPVVQLPTNDPLPAAGLLQSAPSEKPAPPLKDPLPQETINPLAKIPASRILVQTSLDLLHPRCRLV